MVQTNTLPSIVFIIAIIVIVAVIVIGMCFLASQGFNSQVTYSNNDKKIEVQATNSNRHR